jgi:hypothetical protein
LIPPLWRPRRRVRLCRGWCGVSERTRCVRVPQPAGNGCDPHEPPDFDREDQASGPLTYARLFSVSSETIHAAWLNQARDVQLASAPLTGLIAVRDRYDRSATLAPDASGRRCT